MKIINIVLVLLGVSSVSFASERDDFVLVGEMSSSQEKKRLIPKVEQPLLSEVHVQQLENRVEEQDKLIKKLKKDLELLQLTVGSMGGDPPVYQKLIPADLVFWLTVGWASFDTYLKYNGDLFIAGTAFLITSVSIYWVLKEIRNIASVATNRTRRP